MDSNINEDQVTKKNALKNIYIYYGEEKYDIEREIEKIKKQFDSLEQGVNLFNISKTNLLDIYNMCEATTFFGEEKLIIAKDTDLKLDVEKLLDSILGTKTTVIFTQDELDKRTSGYKKLSKIKEVEIKEFKHQDVQTLKSYASNVLSRYNVKLSQDIAEHLLLTCGDDKLNLINELNKLVMYTLDEVEKHGSYTLKKDDIDIVCSKTLSAKVFDMLDDVVNKRSDMALKKLDDLLIQKEPIIKITILLYKQIKQLYMIRYLKDNKETDISAKLSINPYVFKKLNDVSNKYSKEKLFEIIKRFDDYDEKTKLGEMDFEVGLKQIMLMMS